MRKFLGIIFITLFLIVCSGIFAYASTIDSVNAYLTQVQFDNYFSTKDSPTSFNDAGAESVNEVEGGLSFAKTDLSLPGIGGHNLNISRRTNSTIPMDDEGNIYYVTVGNKLSLNETHFSYKYVFKYNIEGQSNSEDIYIAYDTITDMLNAENGTNRITVGENYITEAKFNVHTIADRYIISVAANDIGFDATDPFYLYSMMPEGEDVTLVRDTSLPNGELWLDSVYSYEFTSTKYRPDYKLLGGWTYDIPMLTRVSRIVEMVTDLYTWYTEVYLFTEPESGRNLYIHLDYTKYRSGKVGAYTASACYYEFSSTSREWVEKNITSYDVTYGWTISGADEVLNIKDDKGKTYVFDITRHADPNLARCIDRFGNTIFYDGTTITDTVGRIIIPSKTGITVNGVQVVSYENLVENNVVADPNDYFYVDDKYSFKVCYNMQGVDSGSTIYNYKIGNLKWYTGEADDDPFQSTSDADHFVIESITLPTGAETKYNYQIAMENPDFGGRNKVYLRLSSRYDVTDGEEKNKTFYDYSYNTDNGVFTAQTIITYHNRPNYSVIKRFDNEDNLIQQIEENTDVGNQYYIVKECTYMKSALGRYLLATVVTNTKSVENGTGNSVSESYGYDIRENLVSVYRDGVQILLANYNSYNLLTYYFERLNSAYCSGIQNTFSSDGKYIISSNVARRNENGIVVEYDGTSYAYSSNGDIIKNVVGGVTTNASYNYTTYDGTNPTANYLTVTYTVSSVPTINGTDDETTAQDIVTTETYDFLGRLISSTDAKGNITQYQYDSRGNVIKAINPDNTFVTNVYDYINNTIITTDETGRKVKYEYDDLGYFTKGYLYDGSNWNLVTERSYDTFNNLTDVKMFNDDGTVKGIVEYTYYCDSKPSQELVLDSGNVIGKKQYKYYPYHSSNASATETIAYTSANDYATVSQYTDKYGYKTKDTVAFDGKTYTQTYTTDYAGTILSAKDFKANAEGSTANTVSYTYDYGGRKTRETTTDGSIIYTYDSITGLLSTVEDRKGNVTTYTYDNMGRLATEKSSAKSIAYYYDANSNLAQTRNYIDNTTYNTTKNVYNSRNMLTDVITKPDENNLVIKYVYDDSGRVLKTVEGLSSVDEEINSANHRITEYTYDSYGNVVKETDPMGGVTHYRYNLLGMLVGETDKNGTNTTYNYDINGNLLNKSYVTADGATDSVTYTYDMVGNVISMIDNIGTTQYNYDSIGNLLSEITDNSVKTYTHDANGNVTSFVLSVDGEQQQSITYEYDSYNRVTNMYNGNYKAEYTYDNNGNLLYEHLYEGIRVRKWVGYLYNAENLVKRKQTAIGSGTKSYYMTYDLSGNMQTVNNDGVSTTFTYDGIGRLTSETHSDGADINYTYDKYNNMIAKTDGTINVSYVYDKNNKLLSSTETGADVVNEYNYFYDYNGNLITKTQSVVSNLTETDEEQITLSGSSPYLSTYNYDGWNRLTGANIGGTTANYKYRGNNLREEKTVTTGDNTKTTSFVYNGMDIVYDNNGTKSNDYIRGVAGLIYRVDADDNINYIRTDYHGNVADINTYSGTVIQTYKYDAYGNVTEQTGTDENPFAYCGEYYDEETGFIYLRNRYYDPSLGRFITEDPIQDGINWYAYANNNPLKYIDPLGLVPTPEEAAAMAEHIYKKNYNWESTEEGLKSRTVAGWRLITVWEGRESLKMGIYIPNGDDWENPSEYAVVFRGTDEWMSNEGKNNIEAKFSGNSADMWDAMNYGLGFVNSVGDKEVTFVGHSKGGGEAIVAADYTNKNAITFNAANFNFSKYVSGKGTGTITNYYVIGEILVSTIGEASIGKTKWLPTKVQPDIKWYDSSEIILAKCLNAQIANHDIKVVREQLKKDSKK